jgi:5-amino-6-(5-phosphoribosylamino)uracil reductase
MAGRPHVLVSVAMSADGYIDDASPSRLILSDEADLDRVDELRAGCDAIMVGAGTIRADNPTLAVRSAVRRQRRLDAGLTASPLRVTLTASGDLDPGARIFADSASTPLVYAPGELAALLRTRLAGAATVVGVPEGADNAALSLPWILAELAGRGAARLMVEGGAVLLGQLLSAGLADELILAIAPVLIGDPAAARLLTGAADLRRMTLAAVSQTGDMAILRYLP